MLHWNKMKEKSKYPNSTAYLASAVYSAVQLETG